MSDINYQKLIKCIKPYIKDLQHAATLQDANVIAEVIKNKLSINQNIPTKDKCRALLICLRDEWPDQKGNIQKFLYHDGFKFIKDDKLTIVYGQLVNCLLALVTKEEEYLNNIVNNWQDDKSEAGNFFKSFKDLLENIDHEIYNFENDTKAVSDKEKRGDIIEKTKFDNDEDKDQEAETNFDESKIRIYIMNKKKLKKQKRVNLMWLLLAVVILLIIFYAINYGILMMKKEVVPIATDAKAAGTVEILPNNFNIDY